MFCTNCGKKLSEGARFCSNCGARVAEPEDNNFRTIGGFSIDESKIQTEFNEEASGRPDEFSPKQEKSKVAFDWSNVVDEPHKKVITDVRSPWSTTDSSIDEDELFAEMTPSTDRSRTMSFIDVLKAEKEERSRAAADRAIEYTEVLKYDPDFTVMDEPPALHFAPLYDDVDEHVTTPFDITEAEELAEAEEPVFDVPEAVEEPVAEAAEETHETPVAEEPVETKTPEVEVSRDTIAVFDEYVKSFEKEAGLVDTEAALEAEEPIGNMPKFELPDFLKKMTDFAPASPFEEPAAPEEEPVDLFEEIEEPAPVAEEQKPEMSVFGFNRPEFGADASEEVVFEEPVYEEPEYEEIEFGAAEFEEPSVFEELVIDEPVTDETEPEVEDFVPEIPEVEDSVPEIPEVEVAEPEISEPAVAEPAEKVEEDVDMESMYLDMDFDRADAEETSEDSYASFGKHGAYVEDEPEEEIVFAPAEDSKVEEAEESEEDEDDRPVDEAELFEEMMAEAPKKTGMTIASPADEDSEIEDLKKRLSDLMGNNDDSKDDDEALDYALYFEEAVKPEFSFDDIETIKIDELFEGPAEVTEEEAPIIEETPVVEEAPVIKEVAEEKAPEPEFSFDSILTPIVEDVAEEKEVELEIPAVPAFEEVAEEAQETYVPEIKLEVPVFDANADDTVDAEPAAESEEQSINGLTDALSLEELEKNLFGAGVEDDVEAEETKKIDKFYTLYRKNEEFQRLLDEEYDKLRGEGATEEEPVAEAETPAEEEKAYRAVEDETIYMPKELISELVKDEPAAKSGEINETKSGELFAAQTPASVSNEPAEPKTLEDGEPAQKVSKKEAKKAAKAEKKAAKAKKKNDDFEDDLEYEEVESGSVFLTVLAVIIAIILVILLAVILILQIAPDSGAAMWIDSLIENITQNFSAVYPNDGQFLL